jgi:hypothetical protein
MKKGIITKASYNKQISVYGADTKHWKEAEGRWDYHNKTGNLLQDIKFKRVLEVGTMGVKIWNDSDNLEFDSSKEWTMPKKVKYNHDLNIIPYPIKDKEYDVFIALRVFHHFRKDFIIESFKEWERVANHIIIAMPDTFNMNIIDVVPTKIISCDAKTIIYYYDRSKR